MAALGAKIKWREGKMLHPARLWQAPSKRRIPRIAVEDRALEVGVMVYMEGPWMVFEETKDSSNSIDMKGAVKCEVYYQKYHLLPEKVNSHDTWDWLKNPLNALLIWGKDARYYAKPMSRDS